MASQRLSPPLTAPAPFRLRALILSGTVLSVIALATALVWLVAPQLGPYAESSTPLQHLIGSAGSGPPTTAAVQAALAGATAALGLAALSGRVHSGIPFAAVALVCGGVAAVGFVGFNGIALAGYTLALALPVILVVIAVLAARRPLTGGIAVAALLALAAFAVLGPIPFTRFYTGAAGALAEDPVRWSSALLNLLFSAVWILCGALILTREPSRFGVFVLRHRVALAVLAASCSLPYVLARISWLTPWPLFGGGAIDRHGPVVLATGLMLGAAMLVGGVLTLGLVLPWGSRFPRWLPRIGGRPVPVALAVVPASIVSVLFTAGGVEALLMLFGPDSVFAVRQLTLILVLPFWLWGPLLALATWGYAQHRRSARGR